MNHPGDDLRAALTARGQGHVFDHWERLDREGRGRLLAQLSDLDLDLLDELAELARGGADEEASPRLEPPTVFPLRRDAQQAARAAEARAAGERLLAEGAVGYLLVAGGQASRLGYDGPKGAFPVGPVSERTLFELFARKLRRARARHGAPTPWYVMTSASNDAATRAFFAEHGHFGLDPGDVRFFRQAMLPALDADGRILLKAPDELFLAPNGHGGVLAALAASGNLADARARGVRVLSYFQVDNPLVPPSDPLFLGLHALEGAEMSSKFVRKRDADEKVGVLGRVDGRMGCIEYSDLPDELRHARDDDGELLFGAGNIAVHALQVDFVDALTRERLELPWHRARKRMQVLGADGATEEREGFKFETFVFDALGRAERSVTLEVERAAEFSPVKNAEGEDSPATSRRDLRRLHARWVRSAGLPEPPAAPDGEPAVEVDPLLAESAEELVARRPAAPRVLPAGHLWEAP